MIDFEVVMRKNKRAMGEEEGRRGGVPHFQAERSYQLHQESKAKVYTKQLLQSTPVTSSSTLTVLALCIVISPHRRCLPSFRRDDTIAISIY